MIDNYIKVMVSGMVGRYLFFDSHNADRIRTQVAEAVALMSEIPKSRMVVWSRIPNEAHFPPLHMAQCVVPCEHTGDKHEPEAIPPESGSLTCRRCRRVVS